MALQYSCIRSGLDNLGQRLRERGDDTSTLSEIYKIIRHIVGNAAQGKAALIDKNTQTDESRGIGENYNGLNHTIK